MPPRLILIASRDAAPADLARAFADLPAPERGGGWTWIDASAQAVTLAPKALEAGMKAIGGGPVLLVTTEPGGRGTLRIWSKGRRAFGACFHQALLPEPEEGWVNDGEYESTAQMIDDLWEGAPAGCRPSRATLQQVGRTPPELGRPELLRREAERTAAALERLGIPHERAAVIACLTAESLTEPELEWSHGALPRLLEVIGLRALGPLDEQIEGYWEAADDEEEGEDERAADGPAGEEPERSIAELYDRIDEACDVEPVALDAEVAVPVRSLHHVFYLPWFCDTDVEVALSVQWPEGAAAPRWPERPAPLADAEEEQEAEDDYEGELHARAVGAGQAHVALLWGSVWRRERWLRALGAALAALPEGSALEMLGANVDASDEDEDGEALAALAAAGVPGPIPGDRAAGRHRYRGTVAGGTWTITHAHPAVPGAVLAGALALAARADETGPVEAGSEAEALAILSDAERSGLFLQLPRLDGRSLLLPEADLRPYLLKLFFRRRYRAHYAVGAEEAQERAQQAMLGEIGDRLSEAVAAVAGAVGVPLQPEALVYEGRASRYYRADVSEVKSPFAALGGAISGLFDGFDGDDDDEDEDGDDDRDGDGEPAHDASAEPAERIDRRMLAHGLVPIGDLVADRFADVIVHAYAAEAGGDCYGCLLRGAVGPGAVELVTSFDDGSTLTTSTADADEAPHRKIFRQNLPGADIDQLFAAHAAGVGRFAERGRRSVPVEPSLHALARTMDAFLARQLGLDEPA